MLTITGLTKYYAEGAGRRAVLTDATLRVGRGECIALLGRSGSGKSTLLNLIGGIDLPDRGRIEIAGTVVNALPEPARTRWRRRQVGFVFQFFNLLPTLTCRENVLLPLQLNGLADDEHRDRAELLLRQVGLGARAHSFPEQLSGGEQQRLAIVRALVHGPALLLADEPTGNLDRDTGRRVMRLLLDMARTRHTTTLLVTHSDEVAGQADRIVYCSGGRLLAAPERPAAD